MWIGAVHTYISNQSQGTDFQNDRGVNVAHKKHFICRLIKWNFESSFVALNSLRELVAKQVSVYLIPSMKNE